MGYLLLILLLVLVVVALPSWPHSRGWGYRPVSLAGFLLVVLLVLVLAGVV